MNVVIYIISHSHIFSITMSTFKYILTDFSLDNVCGIRPHEYVYGARLMICKGDTIVDANTNLTEATMIEKYLDELYQSNRCFNSLEEIYQFALEPFHHDLENPQNRNIYEIKSNTKDVYFLSNCKDYVIE